MLKASISIVFLLFSILSWKKCDAQETITVMTWNTWMCGKYVTGGIDKVAAEIEDRSADIVFLQETLSSCVRQLPGKLPSGLYSTCTAKGSTMILYKTDIFTQVAVSVENRFVKLNDNKRRQACQLETKTGGKKISLINLNMDAKNYGPEVGCGIVKVPGFWKSKNDFIMDNEHSYRVDYLEEFLSRFESIPAFSGENVIIGGDMNAPATVDYKLDSGNPNCDLGDFVWPTSATMERHSFVDAYRAVYFSALEHPGITYSPVYGSEATVGGIAYPQDRRDFIYHRSGTTGSTLTPTTAEVYHKTPISQSPTFRKPEGNGAQPAGVKDNAWPSDHSALIVEYEIN